MFKKPNIRRNWQFLIIFLLAIGIFFRCYNLEQKVYWHDEVYTSIRTAGYSGKEVINETFTGQIIQPDYLLKYQQVNSVKSWRDSIDKLIEHPEHPPLYYLLSRFWQLLWGSSISATRSLSVFFSILLLPLVYWFCSELFENSPVGWWAIGIVAISPVQVLYAQEAREYALLLVTTTLSYGALIGAIKRNNWRWWLFYILSLTANLYVSLISCFVAIAQAAYVVVLEKFRLTKTTVNFFISGTIAVVLFSPWLWVIYTRWNTLKAKTSWTNMSRPFFEMLRFWELHLSSIFVDFHPTINSDIAVRIAGFLVIFVSICYQYVYLKTKPQTWLLLGTMITIPAIFLILPDLINGGIKSTMTRYFLPTILGIQITVAYWLTKFKTKKNWTFSSVICLIVFSGIISCGISAQADTWWNKVVGYHNREIAAIINEYSKPLLIANTQVINNNHDVNVGNLISLSHLLDRDVKLLLFQNDNIPLLNSFEYDNILLWNMSQDSRIRFQRVNNCELSLVAGNYDSVLWQVQTRAKK